MFEYFVFLFLHNNIKVHLRLDETYEKYVDFSAVSWIYEIIVECPGFCDSALRRPLKPVNWQ